MTEFRPHGANPDKLYAQFGIPMPARVSDFSTNANAVSAAGTFCPDLRAALEDYPDGEASAVRRMLSDMTGLAEENILVTSGANEAIYIIASLTASRENIVLQPVYGEYRRALAAYGAVTADIYALSDDAVPKGAAVWLCNPCNPTGGYIPDGFICAMAERRPDALFIVDEAYRDFIWTHEAPREAPAMANVIRLRSLTKTYGLCGARIAYAAASAENVRMIKARQPSWSVSGFAQQAALFSLSDGTLLRRTREYYAREVPRLSKALSDAGFDVMPTCVNFFLVRTDDDMALMRFLLERGIAVRHTRNFPSLDGRYVRIAARTREEDDMLISAMRAYGGHCA